MEDEVLSNPEATSRNRNHMGLARRKENHEKDDALLQIREKTDVPSKTVCKGSGTHTASQRAKAAGNVASCCIKQRCRGAGCGSGSSQVT